MNTKPLIITIIAANLCFIVLHVHKYNTIIELHHTQQQLQKELTQLQQKKGQLQQELTLLQDTKAITQYVQKHLHMKPITQRQVRTIT